MSRWTYQQGIRTQIDDFVNNNPAFLKWTDRLKDALYRKQMMRFEISSMRESLYRPFCKRSLYFDSILNQRRYQQHTFFSSLSSENTVICISGIGSSKPFQCLASNIVPCLDLLEKTQTFPYYIYSTNGSSRYDNIMDKTLAQFWGQYGENVTKWDIFHYIYAILHHPVYRIRYAENLKRDLPRIPLLSQREAFTSCVRIGKALMELHLHYETMKEYRLKWIENKDVSINWRVEKMNLSKGKDSLRINEWLTLAGIPQECFQYRLGNRSALEWVIDQYQVSTDARSGIVSDPNREDDEQYIVRLVGKVVTVSVETVKLVEELAQAVKQEDWLHENEIVNEPSQTTEATL